MLDETIIEQNPWWRNKEEIKRDEKVEEALKKKKKLLFKFEEKKNNLWVGPRQVGKTTFFKLLIYDLLLNKKVDPKEVCYFSCDLLRDYKEIIELIKRFSILSRPKYIFLDEVSFVKDWNRAIKFLLDSNLLKDKVLYITGSSSIELKKEKFPGRNIRIKEFLPLSFKEFLNVFGSKKLKLRKQNISFSSTNEIYEKAKNLFPFKEELDYLFYKYLESGGFPRAFYELMESGKIRKETYEIYWNWIISDFARIERSEKILLGVLEGILKNYSNKFSINSIAKETEIGSHVTVREYLEILENLFVIRNFYNFDINKKKIVYRKMRKVYFLDPFILHSVSYKLRGMPYKDYAKIVEGIVVETLIRRLDFLNVGFYYGRKEVDACFKDFGIEVKWQETVNPKDFPKVEIKNKIIVSKNDFLYLEDKNLLIIPASLFLAML